MTEHLATITWARETESFAYPDYNRSHLWRFENGETVAASAAPEFLGTSDRANPEEAYVAAVSSCHMLTFLAICARKRIVVDAYVDRAVGHMELNERGRLAVTRIRLSPRITWGGEAPSDATLRKIHHQSHEECFIANSVLTKIEVEGL